MASTPLRYEGTPQDYNLLEAAVQRAVGPCVCGPLMRRGIGQKCRPCEQVTETLASLLAATDVQGRATVTVWAEHRECPEVFRLREPTR